MSKLLIAIPALNEEESIEAIIERSLDASDHIRRNSSVDEVDVTVVSDGSTDHTVELASRYTDRIKLIVFEKNRGYGAAIKEAWKQSDADLLGFLDADGTCEPKFFATLCKTAEDRHADVVLGCRLNKDSQMPLVRRVGNFIFATILSVFSSSRVRDTASGMRVVRRSSLDHLYPLPDGLHFTPAMSARAMLSSRVQIQEVDMPYRERAGESKLSVVKDGIRFLKVILEAAFLYRPSRPLGIIALAMAALVFVLMAQPVAFAFQHGSIPDWMIYRFLISELLAIGACLFACAAYLTDRMVELALTEESGGKRGWSATFFRARWFWAIPIGLATLGLSQVLDSVLTRIATGGTYEHWSRYVAMSTGFLMAFTLSMTRVIDYVFELVGGRVKYLKSQATERI